MLITFSDKVLKHQVQKKINTQLCKLRGVWYVWYPLLYRCERSTRYTGNIHVDRSSVFNTWYILTPPRHNTLPATVDATGNNSLRVNRTISSGDGEFPIYFIAGQEFKNQSSGVDIFRL